MSPAGGYGGLVPAFFRYGPLDAYFLGQDQGNPDRRTWLLGCDCGEVGCWPLAAHIDTDDDAVVWKEFAQPHRPTWNYSGFGPFTFERASYEAAVAQPCRTFG